MYGRPKVQYFVEGKQTVVEGRYWYLFSLWLPYIKRRSDQKKEGGRKKERREGGVEERSEGAKEWRREGRKEGKKERRKEWRMEEENKRRNKQGNKKKGDMQSDTLRLLLKFNKGKKKE